MLSVNYKKSIFLIASIFVFIGQIHSQTETVTQIENYVKSVSRLTKNKKQRIFADTSSDENANWQEFKTETLRENADTGDNLNQNAYVWLENKKIVVVVFTFQSSSRDWAHFVNYYFRPNGTLAKVEAKLNTFYGNMTIERNYYVNTKGKILIKNIKYRDLSSQKPISNDDVKKRFFYDEGIKVFKTVSSLPFIKLIK